MDEHHGRRGQAPDPHGGAPGRLRRRAILALALPVLVAGALLAGCGEGNEGTVIETSDQGPVPGATEPGQKPPESGELGTGPAATEPESGTAGGTAGSSSGDPEKGRAVFASAGCGGCHTLVAAGSNGTVGPNLDELHPSYEDARDQVEHGGGGMPAFEGELTEQEISDVAAFVAEATKG